MNKNNDNKLENDRVTKSFVLITYSFFFNSKIQKWIKQYQNVLISSISPVKQKWPPVSHHGSWKHPLYKPLFPLTSVSQNKMPFFLPLLILSLFSSASACDRCVHQAKAAFYQDESAGLCTISILTLLNSLISPLLNTHPNPTHITFSQLTNWVCFISCR